MKVLVTGANGQLGLTLKKYVEQIKISDNFKFVSKQELDITKVDQIQDHFNKDNYNYCINCAAYTNVRNAEIETESAFKVNDVGVTNLVEVCREKDVILIHISTDYVFDGKNRNPYKTIDDPNPINQYGRSKLKGECYIIQNTAKYFIIRTSWLYSEFNGNFLKTIINKIKQNENLNIVTSETGSPTSCLALVEFIYFLISNSISKYGTYHFTSLDSTNWYLYAKHIAAHFPSYDSTKIKPIKNFPNKVKRPSYSVLDLSKTLDMYPKINGWKDDVTSLIEKHINDKT